jgi:hypothetical protein
MEQFCIPSLSISNQIRVTESIWPYPLIAYLILFI